MGDRILCWVFDRVFPWLILALGALLVFGLIAFVWDAVTAETFALRKDSWVCTASHTETVTTYIQVGNVMVPQTSTSTVCDQWGRR